MFQLKCDICNQAFTQSSSLNYHKRTKHDTLRVPTKVLYFNGINEDERENVDEDLVVIIASSVDDEENT